MTWKPRLRTVLSAVNILILLLPIGGIAILRLYESELIRQTESELIAQAAVIAAAFRQELIEELDGPDPILPGYSYSAIYGNPVDPNWRQRENPDFPFDPVVPKLDAARDPVRPPPANAVSPSDEPDAIALRAGKRIRRILAATARVTLAGIRVTDFRGTVVASTGSESGMSLLHLEEVSRALTGEPVTLLRERIPTNPSPPLDSISRRARVRVQFVMPVVQGDRVMGAVVASRTPLDILKALYLNSGVLIAAGLALIAVVIVVSVLTSLTISRPVKALIGQAQQVARGEQAAAIPLERPGTWEVDRLSRALAHMSVVLEQRAQYIRTFASNVSHEFKTPLTSIRASIELLSDHMNEMSTEERRRFLEILQADTERLQRLVSLLLELARADVLTPGSETADIRQVVDQVATRYEYAGLSVPVEHGQGIDHARISPEILESILTNLLDNAFQHGGEGVEVQVQTSTHFDERGPFVEIRVADTGQGISATDTALVFQPFYTTSRKSGRTGLGLSIVRALVTAHGGDITIEPSSVGSCFVIRIPAAKGSVIA